MSNPAETPQNDSEQRPSSDPPVSPTVLVVDDERNIRRTLDLVLRGEGYDVVEAEKIFSTLMGDKVEPRRIFIETHALDVQNLDI
jgi:DNA-binding response OmpR family regulator